MTNEEARDQIVIFMCDEQKVINDRDKQALEMAIKALEQEPKWIPVSEKLPEHYQNILFSTKTDRVFEGRYFKDETEHQWYSFRDECFAWNNVVTAWMPLPKPYKPQESDDKCKNCKYYLNPDYTRCHECKAESEELSCCTKK